jgi:hypothetical protein
VHRSLKADRLIGQLIAQGPCLFATAKLSDYDRYQSDRCDGNDGNDYGRPVWPLIR